MKSLLFAFALIFALSSAAQAQIYAGDDNSSSGGPPTVHYRDGKPYVPGYNAPGAAKGQSNSVQVGRPYPYYPYYGYPGYGYGPGAYSENTVVVGQPYYGYGYGYGYGPGMYNDGNTVVVGQPYYGGWGYGY